MDEILIRAGIFQGVEPHAADALAQALEPAEFPRGHVIFAEGEPGDRLYIIGRQGEDRSQVARTAGRTC